MRNTYVLTPMIMGAVGRTEIGTEGMAETDAVNTAEDTVGMGAVGMAGVAAADTLTSAASPSPSKGSTNERNRHTDKKGRVNLAKKKGKREEGGKIAHTHEFLFFGFKNPPPQDRLIVWIFKNVLRFLSRQSSVRPTGGRNWDGGKSNYQRGTILHSLR